MSACSVARLTAVPLGCSGSEPRRSARNTRALPADTLAGGRWAGVPLPKRRCDASRSDLAVEQAEPFELVDHELRALLGRLLLRSENELRISRRLVGIRHAGELLELDRESLDGGVDEDLDERAVLLDQLARRAARRLVR